MSPKGSKELSGAQTGRMSFCTFLGSEGLLSLLGFEKAFELTGAQGIMG